MVQPGALHIVEAEIRCREDVIAVLVGVHRPVGRRGGIVPCGHVHAEGIGLLAVVRAVIDLELELGEVVAVGVLWWGVSELAVLQLVLRYLLALVDDAHAVEGQFPCSCRRQFGDDQVIQCVAVVNVGEAEVVYLEDVRLVLICGFLIVFTFGSVVHRFHGHAHRSAGAQGWIGIIRDGVAEGVGAVVVGLGGVGDGGHFGIEHGCVPVGGSVTSRAHGSDSEEISIFINQISILINRIVGQ